MNPKTSQAGAPRPSSSAAPSPAIQALHTAVQQANGMLPPAVYEAIWSLAGRTPGPHWVEVGTAHGAATIALALGSREGRQRTLIHTIDRMGGRFSSRAKFGNVETNEAIATRNFREAGVADLIRLFVGASEDFPQTPDCPERIELLMLDADGRIDRDLGLFYDRLPAGAPIVIDDADDAVFLGRAADGSHYVDLKHRITALLVAAFQQAGFLGTTQRVRDTLFCARGTRPMNRPEFEALALGRYRDLVFTTVTGGVWEELIPLQGRGTEIQRALRIAAAIPPWLIRLARLVRRR